MIVSILLSLVVVAGLLTAGLLVLSQSHNNTVNNLAGGAGTATASTSSSTPINSPIFSDPLTSNANDWSSDQHCFFRSDGYHIAGNWECFAPTDIPNNFTAQVRVKQISGPAGTGYGLVFRRTSQGNEYYFFIDSYGHWRVDKCVNSNCSILQDWTSSGGAIDQGLNMLNTIEVSATGSNFVFFANGQQLGQVHDSTFTSGLFGLVGDDTIEVVYSDLVINQIL